MQSKRALLLSENDNVAVALEDVEAGEEVHVVFGKRCLVQLQAVTYIPRYHKIALCSIARQETVIKYGYPIAVASVDIRRGEHVHIHNADSIAVKPEDG